MSDNVACHIKAAKMFLKTKKPGSKTGSYHCVCLLFKSNLPEFRSSDTYNKFLSGPLYDRN